jgi:hypothetical protein
MFSKRKARLIAFVVFAATVGGGLFAYVTPASTKVDPMPVDGRPIAIEPTYRSWGEDLSANAVDSAGIELDLDGNAASLFPSDWRENR